MLVALEYLLFGWWVSRACHSGGENDCKLKGATVRLEMLLRCVGAVRVTAVLALKWATSKLALG